MRPCFPSNRLDQITLTDRFPGLSYTVLSVKKQPSASASDPSSVHPVGPVTEADEEWHKFDDDKVSVVGRDKIGSLEGGGEDSAAYILVYRSVWRCCQIESASSADPALCGSF